jgi:hypothetical protein
MPRNKPFAPARASLVDIFRDGFVLYELADPGSVTPLWVRFKLMREVDRKQWGTHNSYWLRWGVDARRFRRDSHTRNLAEGRPELHDEVAAYLRANYNEAWLLSPTGAGLTPARLQAERAKFADIQAAAARARR